MYIPYTFALAHRIPPRYNTTRIKNELREHERVLPHKKEVMKNEEEFSGKLERYPERNEIPIEINDVLVVEFYSKQL